MKKKRGGFTLIEILISITLLMVVMAASYKLFDILNTSTNKTIKNNEVVNKSLIKKRELLTELIFINRSSLVKIKKNTYKYETWLKERKEKRITIENKKVIIEKEEEGKWVEDNVFKLTGEENLNVLLESLLF